MAERAPRVILAVTGGIAAYKSAEVVRRLRDLGCDVTVAATASALEFVGEPTWAALSGKPVLSSIWQSTHTVAHVSAARQADVIVVAPATADCLSRTVQGRGDDVVGALLLMATCPVLMAPAMHTEMWLNAATAANVAVLRERGFLVVQPDVGRLTGPDSGPGRLPAPESLAALTYAAATRPAGLDLAGRSVVVTAGGTREALDPVRWLGNRSSGRMGYAIAAAAVARGASVHVIAANVNLPDVAGATTEQVTDHASLAAAVDAAARGTDALVMAAAVSDYTHSPQTQKVSRAPGQPWQVSLQATADILAGVAAARPEKSPMLIGFAAQTEPDEAALIEQATAKLVAKGVDAVVANDVSGGAVFGEDEAAVVIVTRDGSVTRHASQPKLDIAHRVCDLIASPAV